MAIRYTCQHHGALHKARGEISHRVCGCDGSVHYACMPAPAPVGTERPADWPVHLAWCTEQPHPDSPHQNMMDFLEESDQIIESPDFSGGSA